jgi:hypothetical protein
VRLDIPIINQERGIANTRTNMSIITSIILEAPQSHWQLAPPMFFPKRLIRLFFKDRSLPAARL